MLAALVEGAREDQAAREASVPLRDLVAMAQDAPQVKPHNSLRRPGLGLGVIAEVKRASPSRGPLAEIPNPVSLAREYEAGGAAAISVLTEGRRFKGSLADLTAVSQAVSIPVLRKDFLTTEYHIVEARAFGADLVLLILACLSDEEARFLHDVATSWGMGVLVETHSAEEVDRAVALGASLIGINARDLTSFELDRGLFGTLAPRIPAGVVKVAESAIASVDDVRAYQRAGADLVLVGEALVTGGSPREMVKEFSSV